MKTLYQHYQSIRESYYAISVSPRTLFADPNGKEHCQIFIKQHFEKGKKKRVFSIPERYMQIYQDYGKHQHTVSLYLLGCLCKRQFSDSIKQKMQSLFDVAGWYRYEYTWYLACLYHDITSSIERDASFAGLTDIVEKSKLFDYETLLRFPKSTYINYLRYRRDSGSAEHGIVAGSELFDCLYESFYENTAGHCWDIEPIYRRENIDWRREHLPHFAYISDAICCHNIWLAPEKNKTLCRQYQEAELANLVVHQDADKLSFRDYPLQFMLCLLDTIEPVKRFEYLPPDVVLKNIYLELYDTSLTLGWTPLIKEQPQFFDWLKPIASIGEWMQINGASCICKDNLCSISLSWNND